MRDRLKAVLAPEALKCTEMMAAANRHALLCAIGVEHHIVGGVFGQSSLPTHRRDESAGAGLDRPQI
jgi:hypothetical protein